MAVTYGFFNSVNGDRKYNAEQMSEYFRGIINEGVYQHLDGGLAVTAGTGLAVNVAAGRAIIQNRWVQNSAAMSLTIAAASETYARKDAVVIRLNWSSRAISIAVKTGTPAASPVAPSMTRNATTYEMALAYVNVAANATSVTVTDKRSDSTVCGWVTVAQSTSGEVDAQLNAMKTGFDGVVYNSPAEAVQTQIGDLHTQLSTIIPKKAVAYIGSAGHFVFKYANFFSNNKCAWKLDGGGINIKLPKTSAAIGFTNDQIMESLGTMTYDDGTTIWALMDPCTALVYNSTSGTLVIRYINASTPLDDYDYPLLMFWYGQIVGGMLYEKFLYDMQQVPITSLTTKLATQLNREPCMYIGSGGKFKFKDNSIFDAAGRCKWILEAARPGSATGLNIKLPNKSVVGFTMSQIITALGSAIYDDGTTTWAYMAAQTALVFDSSNNSLAVRSIGGTTPLQDNDYPILMVWYEQMVGGMMYSKFLNDALNQNITSKDLDKRTMVNADVQRRLSQSRHIAHVESVSVASPLTLLHFSDIHGDTSALSRILSDKTYFGDSIDDVICTGDMVVETGGAIQSWWPQNVLTCIGNHDSATHSEQTGWDWTAVSMANRDAYYIAPFESNWGIVHTSGTSYYYKDYASQNVRLIVMDGMLYISGGSEATAQTNWLESLLSDAITNNLHVLIAIHAPHGGATSRECSFSKYGEYIQPTLTDCNTPQIVIDAVATAITNGLHFVGYIVGHTHQDNIWDAENDGKQLMYCVTCGNVSSRARWLPSDQNRSMNEDAYNLVSIDTVHTLVKIVRGGGADSDDHMRPRKMICFDYSTGQIVGEEN